MSLVSNSGNFESSLILLRLRKLVAASTALSLALAAVSSTAALACPEVGVEQPVFEDMQPGISDAPAVVRIFDVRRVPGVLYVFRPGILVLEDGKKVGPRVTPDARAVSENLIQTRDYYKQVLNRNSYDGQGSPIEAKVNVGRIPFFNILGHKANASWAAGGINVGAGKRFKLDGFAQALDVIAHEFTHGVIESTSNLKYEKQSGALNEHFADVFGAAIEAHYGKDNGKPYWIGDTVLRGKYKAKAKTLRDMLNPALGAVPQPGHVSQIGVGEFAEYGPDCTPTRSNDLCGVHVLSGIPNRVAALIFEKVGFKTAIPLFYDVMTERLDSESDFAAYAKALRDRCGKVASSENKAALCGAVESALVNVGL